MTGKTLKHDEIRAAVRERYADVITEADAGSCGCGCSGTAGEPATETARMSGYSEEELATVPAKAAQASLGCGNPTAMASIRPGETVLDIGSGAGLDCFLASQRVGSEGRVIGLDMTPEMIARAEANARKAGAVNVEFRLGTAEQIPVEDTSVDLVISNCVINLSPDKEGVFREVARVLRPGGRMVVSDIVLTAEIPEAIRGDLNLWGSCLSGALLEDDYLAAIRAAGLTDVTVESRVTYDAEAIEQYLAGDTVACSAETGGRFSEADRAALVGHVHSVKISARKSG
jgi:SAM-dependent methyltransferase